MYIIRLLPVLFVVRLYCDSEYIDRAGDVLGVYGVGHAHLVETLAGSGVERLAAGHEHGLLVVVELIEQEQLELIRVVYRQGHHRVERASRRLADDAGDLVQLGDKRVAAVAVLIAHSVEVARVERVEFSRGDLLDCCRAQAALTPFERLSHEVLVLRDDHADAREKRLDIESITMTFCS